MRDGTQENTLRVLYRNSKKLSNRRCRIMEATVDIPFSKKFLSADVAIWISVRSGLKGR